MAGKQKKPKNQVARRREQRERKTAAARRLLCERRNRRCIWLEDQLRSLDYDDRDYDDYRSEQDDILRTMTMRERSAYDTYCQGVRSIANEDAFLYARK